MSPTNESYRQANKKMNTERKKQGMMISRLRFALDNKVEENKELRYEIAELKGKLERMEAKR